MQLAQRRLALAEENRDRFSRILDINTIRFKKGYIAEVDLIRIRLQMVDFHSQVIQSLQEAESARGDLRQLLRLSPTTTLELTTDLEFQAHRSRDRKIAVGRARMLVRTCGPNDLRFRSGKPICDWPKPTECRTSRSAPDTPSKGR